MQATDRRAAADDEAAEATALAKRALTRSNESARAGQRADAAKWTAAAQVFAMRLRDARDERAALESQLDAAAQRSRQVTQALAQNVGRLQAVAAARLPVLSGRKAARLQGEVDEVVVAISAPTADLVARATAAARDAAAEAADGESTVDPVEVDDLENALDVTARAILAELRRDGAAAARRAPAPDRRKRRHRPPPASAAPPRAILPPTISAARPRASERQEPDKGNGGGGLARPPTVGVTASLPQSGAPARARHPPLRAPPPVGRGADGGPTAGSLRRWPPHPDSASPFATGYLHVGGARRLFTARCTANGGEMVLRIEDTDAKKNPP